MSEVLRARTLLAARERDGVERLAAGRARLVARDVLLETQRWLGVGDGDPRGVLDQELLGLHVDLLALALVYGGLTLLEQLVHLGVLVVGDVQCVSRSSARAPEEHVEEVVRVPVVPGPSEKGHRVIARARPLQVGAPLVCHELGGHADLLEILLHRLGYALAVWHVWPWDRHVPQVGLQVLHAGVLEHLHGLVRVVGIMLDALVEERHGRRHVGRCDLPCVPEEGLHDRVHVYGLVDRPPHVDVVEGLLLGVHREVPDRERRAELHLEARLLDGRDVVGSEAVGRGELAACERSHPGGVVRDGADRDLLDLRTAPALARGHVRSPPVLVGLKLDCGAPVPLHELERAGADRVLPEVLDVLLYRLGRGDPERAHGDVLEERPLRLLEVDAHRVLVHDVDARYDGVVVEAPELAHVVGEVLALAPAALVVGVVAVAPAVEVELDRLGVELGAVVELYAVPELEGVGPAAVLRLGDLGRERGYYVGALWREVEQAVEDLARHPQRLAVCGVDRVERYRVRPTPEDEGVAPCAAATSATLDGPAPTATCHAEQRRAGQARATQPEEVTAAYLDAFSWQGMLPSDPYLMKYPRYRVPYHLLFRAAT